MAAIDFPASPTNGQVFAASNGVTYRYVTPPGIWTAGSVADTAFTGSTPPASPQPNQLWWHSDLGQLFIYYNDGNSSQWVPCSPAMTNTVAAMPTGAIIDYSGTTAPFGWYICDGALKNRTTDAALFAVIGTRYGAGDGSTTFALPDLGGRVTAGKEATATRLTTAGSGVDGATLGAAGGTQTHTLTVSQMPVHGHSITFPGAAGTTPLTANGGQGNWGAAPGSGSPIYYSNPAADPNGNGLAHPITQPTIIMNKIIKA
jgi:microcystin-dependent protein